MSVEGVTGHNPVAGNEKKVGDVKLQLLYLDSMLP